MTEPRGYEDGAFYWVRLPRGEWGIGEYERGLGVFRMTGDEEAFQPREFAEIGPRIGKEPPKPKAPKRQRPPADRPATSPELDRALSILLART